MKLSDLDQIMTIEKSSFSYPWSSRFFLQEIKVPCARSVLAVTGDRIIGYVVYWLLPGEVDIHNLAVRPDCRRRGIGRSLLLGVVRHARYQGARRVTLEVRKTNGAAQRLYESIGFVTTGIRKGYYSDDGEDALAMSLELNP